MNVREFINNNSAAATIVAVVLLLIALGVIIWQNKGIPSRDFQSFYFDLNTQELFVDDSTRVAPFDRGTGAFEYFDGSHGSAVRAIVFTCNDPADIHGGMTLQELEAAGGYIAYLERQSPGLMAVQTKIEAGEPLTEADHNAQYDGTIIAAIDGQAWFNLESEPGARLIGEAVSRCGAGQQALVCQP